MTFALTAEQLEIREAVARLCERFGDDYWLKKDTEGAFPHEFHRAMAEAGWLGVAMPEEYGGSGLGITEAAIVMQAVAQSGAGFSGASAVHMNIFGLHPVVVFGTDEQKQRWLPPMAAGETLGCFALTEPDHGSDPANLRGSSPRTTGATITSSTPTAPTRACTRDSSHTNGRSRRASRTSRPRICFVRFGLSWHRSKSG